MTLKEKALYHQIHPAKLATDIVAAIVSLYLLWQHQIVASLAVHFLPPLAASWVLMRYADLAPLQQSTFGRYIGQHMTRTIEAVRLLGDVATLLGAWYHDALLIAGGVIVIVGAWCNGLIPSKQRRT